MRCKAGNINIEMKYFIVIVNLTVDGTEEACGSNKPLWITNSPEGYIQSPNYPNNYPNNSDCAWIIQVNPGTNLRLQIDDVSIENG